MGGVGAGMAHKVSSVAVSESVVICYIENVGVVACNVAVMVRVEVVGTVWVLEVVVVNRYFA